MKQSALFYAVSAIADVDNGFVHIFGREGCEKSQTACIDTKYWNLFVAYDLCHVEECSVAAHAHGNVCGEVVVLNNFFRNDFQLQIASDEVVKWFVNGELCALLLDDFDETAYRFRLMLLIYVAK